MKAICAACGNGFAAKRSTAKYCSTTCRSRGHRAQGGATVTTLPTPPQPTGLVAVTQRALEAADRLDTVLGQQALELAARIVSPFSTGSSVATLSRELRTVMAEALKDVELVDDPVDQLAKRRQMKAQG